VERSNLLNTQLTDVYQRFRKSIVNDEMVGLPRLQFGWADRHGTKYERKKRLSTDDADADPIRLGSSRIASTAISGMK
jgi:hypothetical protein